MSKDVRSRALPRVHRLQADVFYGWFVVGGAFFVSLVSVGVGFYGQTVFLDGLIHEKGWSRESVSAASTLYFLTAGVTGMAVGRMIDRVGTRIPLATGALTMAAGLLWLGHIESPTELYAVYALLATAFSMSAAIPLSTLVSRWFHAQRSKAMSLSQTGVSVGGLILVPLATGLIASQGLRSATVQLAFCVVLLTLPIILFVLRETPEEFGLQPDGRTEPSSTGPPQPPMAGTREVILSPSFVLLASAFAGILVCQTGTAVHHLHLLREHLDTSVAALGATTLPIGSIVGRLATGRFADRFDKRRVAAVLFLLQGVALAALSTADHVAGLLAFSLVFGLTVGAVFMMQSLLVADLWGLSSFATILGVLSFVASLGGGLGPLLVGVLADRFGGYPVAFRTLALLAAVAALVVTLVPRPQAQRDDS